MASIEGSGPDRGSELAIHGQLDGRPVYTRDGQYLGEVSAIERGVFKINAPRALDYWLPLTMVRDIVEGQVLLHLDAADVIPQRLTFPPEEPRAY